jgi:CheY-like chemotaxis protein/HPt (histidine-containing phosphotransfer) domain-containing protein
VGNAIKFTEHGEIFVELTVDSSDDEGYVLRTVVHDSGIGIATEDQTKLFDAFSQVDGSMVRKHGGTGLGLAISKRLVAMMGGEIGLVSQRGVGSSFWFTIRTPRSDAPQRPALPDVLKGRRVLVVEANRRWCRIIEEHMTAWGLTSEVFYDGRSALHRLRSPRDRGRFDIAVVGADLRDVDTREFVKELRGLDYGKELPLILLTQLGSGATLSEVENEITAQVAKPLRLSELYDRIIGAFSKGVLPSPLVHYRREKNNANTHRRVLVVDDNEINQFVAVEELQQVGYATEVANNGAEALEKIKNGRFNAVLMDCQMPVMDGYTAVRELRAWEALNKKKRMLVIALTAHAMAGERDKVIEAGMDDYLSKPLRANALEKMLRRHLGESTPPGADTTPPESKKPVDLDMSIERSQRLIRLFINRVPSDLESLATSTANATAVRELAHKLKGSCLALGADAMAADSEALQHEAERGEVAAFEPRIKSLREGFERVTRLLERELVGDESANRRTRTSVAPAAT